MWAWRKRPCEGNGEDGHLQVKERGLRRKLTYWHLDLELLVLDKKIVLLLSHQPTILYYTSWTNIRLSLITMTSVEQETFRSIKKLRAHLAQEFLTWSSGNCYKEGHLCTPPKGCLLYLSLCKLCPLELYKSTLYHYLVHNLYGWI